MNQYNECRKKKTESIRSTLLEKKKITSENVNKLLEILDEYFGSIVKSLGIIEIFYNCLINEDSVRTTNHYHSIVKEKKKGDILLKFSRENRDLFSEFVTATF